MGIFYRNFLPSIAKTYSKLYGSHNMVITIVLISSKVENDTCVYDMYG